VLISLFAQERLSRRQEGSWICVMSLWFNRRAAQLTCTLEELEHPQTELEFERRN